MKFFQFIVFILKIQFMNILTKNMDLLHVLVAVGEEQNLTRAAYRLGLSQPAMSHALNRLRRDIGDPLFVRTARGLIPTPRAQALIPKAKELLLLAEAIYQTGPEENFLQRPRRFVLACTAYFEQRILDRLLARLEKDAPLTVLHTLPLHEGFPGDALARGEMDLAVAAYFQKVPGAFRLKTLGKDEHVCLMRKKHPFLRSPGGVADYLSYGHVKIAVPPGKTSAIDEKLADSGLERRIVAHLANFLTPAGVLAKSDLILTCPRTLAESYRRMFPLEIAALPIEVKPVEAKMAWHERCHQDQFHRWARTLLAQLTAAGQ